MTVTQDVASANNAGLNESMMSEHGRDKDGENIAQCTVGQAAFNTFFYMFAAVQLPYALAQGGWFWGTSILLVCSVISTHSGWVLTDICVRNKTYTWKDLAFVSTGRQGKWFIEGLQIFSIFFTSMIQTQGGYVAWQQAFPSAPICAWQWMLLNAVPYFLFLQVPSFSGSNAMKLATAITLFGTLWRIAMYVGAFTIWGGYHYKCYDGQTLTTIFNGAANLMGSFGVKVCIPEMIREMKNPGEYGKAWSVSQAFVVPLYIGVSLWGFALFGTFVNGTNLFLNFKMNWLMEAYFLGSTITGYMPLCYGQILFFLKVELHYGVLPTDWFKISNPETNRWPSIPPFVFRLLWRGGMLAIWLFLGEMLIGFSVFLLFSFFSAISSAAFSFYLPYVFSWCKFGHEFSAFKKAYYALFIVISMALSGIGAYSAASQMGDMDTQLFAFEETCSQGAFFVGTWTGNGYHGDWGGYSDAQGNGTFHDTFYLATCGGKGNINCGQSCAPNTCCWADSDKQSHVTCAPACQP